jgi:protein TonB
MSFHSFEMRGLTTRRLRYAIVASLLLHLLILWPASLRVLTKDTPLLLQATLRLMPQAPAEQVPPKSPPRALPPAPTFAPSVPKPESRVLEQPTPLSVPHPPAALAEPVLKPIPEAGPVTAGLAATSVPAVAGGSAGGSLMTDANASGEAADGLRGYRLALATQARRFKRYPPQAMARGWTGTADIRVEVGSDGAPHAATVVRSSGHELLDGAALAMIDAGALRARLPESLRGKPFAVVLPVVFNLDDG